MSVRNRGLERAALRRAERGASVDPTLDFTAAVTARLDAYGRQHGDSFDERPIADLLTELAEECLDIGGWSVLAMTLLEQEVLPPATRERLAANLDVITALGAEAYAVVTRTAAALHTVAATSNEGAA